MVNVKTLKPCENLIKFSSEIKQYKKNTTVNLINDFEQGFLMGTAIK